jgi:hypothetical protein
VSCMLTLIAPGFGPTALDPAGQELLAGVSAWVMELPGTLRLEIGAGFSFVRHDDTGLVALAHGSVLPGF